MNVLKWFVSTHTEQGTQGIEAKSGRVRRTLIDFSIARWVKCTTNIIWIKCVKSSSRCEEFLRSRDHVDLDVAPAQLWEHQWEQFLTEYYSIIQGGAKIQEYYEGSRRSEELLAQVETTIGTPAGHNTIIWGSQDIGATEEGLPGTTGDGWSPEPVDHKAGILQPGPRNFYQQQVGSQDLFSLVTNVLTGWKGFLVF